MSTLLRLSSALACIVLLSLLMCLSLPAHAALPVGLSYYNPSVAGQVAYSSTGMVAVSEGFGTIGLYTSAGVCVRRLERHLQPIRRLCFSADGQWLASVDSSTVMLWQVSDGTLVRTLNGQGAAAFSPNGQLLATVSLDARLVLWRLSDGTSVWSQPLSVSTQYALSFSPNGDLLASADGACKIWRVSDSMLLRKVSSPHAGALIGDVNFLDEKRLVTIDSSREARVWGTDGISKMLLCTSQSRITALGCSVDGQTSAVGREDGAIMLIRITDGLLLRTFGGHPAAVSAIAFSADGSLLASADRNAAFFIRQVSDGTIVNEPAAHAVSSQGIAYSPDGQFIATSGSQIQLWNAANGKPIRMLSQAKGLYGVMAFSPDSTMLATGGDAISLSIWRVSDGALLRTIYTPGQFIRAAAFSPDGTLLATAGSDNTITLRNVSDGTIKDTLTGHTRCILSLAFSPDNHWLASASSDGTVRLWDMPSGAVLQILRNPDFSYYDTRDESFWSVAFSPDSQMLVAGSAYQNVYCWQLGTYYYDPYWYSSWEYPTSSGVYSVAVAPDGKTVAAGEYAGGQVWLLDAETGQQQSQCQWHLNNLYALAYSPRDGQLAAAGDDGFSVWRTSGSQPDLSIKGPSDTDYLGNHLYNELANATSTQMTSTGATVNFLINLRNDGLDSEPFTLFGSIGNSGLTTRYFDAASDGNDITAQITSTGWTSPVIAPGMSYVLRAEMTLDETVPVQTVRALLVEAFSTLDNTKTDIVSAQTTKAPLSAVTLATTPLAPQIAGVPITLTATPSGGMTIEYQFRSGYQDNGGWHWSIIRDYETTATCTWTPSSARQYTLAVWAREQGSALNYDAPPATQTYNILAPVSAVNLSVSPAAPRYPDTAITLTATPTDGINVEYRFRVGYQSAQGWRWTDLSNYGPATTCVWTPVETRSYTLVVWAREVGSNSLYTVAGIQPYRISAPPITAVRVTAAPTAPEPVGTHITINTQVTGGSHVECKFRAGYQDASGWHWADLTGYSTATSTIWTPAAPHRYTLVVYTREAGSNVTYQCYGTLNYSVSR